MKISEHKAIFLFLTIFIFLLFSVFFALPHSSLAAGATATWDSSPTEKSITFTAQVPIPGLGKTIQIDGSTFGNYIKAIYKYAIGIIGILATVVLMFGGFLWLTAGGSSDKVSQAKTYITGAITGLVLALSSYLILGTINPDLVTFNKLPVTTVSKLGCCEDASTNKCIFPLTQEKCHGTWREGIYTCYNNKCISNDEIKKENCALRNGTIFPGNQGQKCGEKCGSSNYLYSSFSYKYNNVEYYCCVCDPCGGKKDGTGCSDPADETKGAVCVKEQCSACGKTGQNCSFNWCCAGSCCEDISGLDKCTSGVPTRGKYCK